MRILLFTLLLTFSMALSATEDQVKFENKQQEELYKDLLQELRCPKCQNQNIADSNAVVAKDMRAQTKELVDKGQNKQQVIDYMVNRYGQFAHYRPPINMATIMLWVLPLAFMLFAVLMLVKRSKQKSQVVTAKENSNQQDNSLDQKLDEELEALLADEDKNK
jgi:cytochrome c-type biogenesis protein CcmH